MEWPSLRHFKCSTRKLQDLEFRLSIFKDSKIFKNSNYNRLCHKARNFQNHISHFVITIHRLTSRIFCDVACLITSQIKLNCFFLRDHFKAIHLTSANAFCFLLGFGTLGAVRGKVWSPNGNAPVPRPWTRYYKPVVRNAHWANSVLVQAQLLK